MQSQTTVPVGKIVNTQDFKVNVFGLAVGSAVELVPLQMLNPQMGFKQQAVSCAFIMYILHPRSRAHLLLRSRADSKADLKFLTLTSSLFNPPPQPRRNGAVEREAPAGLGPAGTSPPEDDCPAGPKEPLRVIDAFSKYDNLLAFNVGNEVLTTDATNTAPFIKAAARDIKAYLTLIGSSALVRYADIDGTAIRMVQRRIPDTYDGINTESAECNVVAYLGGELKGGSGPLVEFFLGIFGAFSHGVSGEDARAGAHTGFSGRGVESGPWAVGFPEGRTPRCGGRAALGKHIYEGSGYVPVQALLVPLSRTRDSSRGGRSLCSVGDERVPAWRRVRRCRRVEPDARVACPWPLHVLSAFFSILLAAGEQQDCARRAEKQDATCGAEYMRRVILNIARSLVFPLLRPTSLHGVDVGSFSEQSSGVRTLYAEWARCSAADAALLSVSRWDSGILRVMLHEGVIMNPCGSEKTLGCAVEDRMHWSVLSPSGSLARAGASCTPIPRCERICVSVGTDPCPVVEDERQRRGGACDSYRRFAAPPPNHRRAPPTNAVASAHDPKGPPPQYSLDFCRSPFPGTRRPFWQMVILQVPPLRLQPIPHTSAHNVRPESTQRHPQTFLSTKPSREQFMPPCRSQSPTSDACTPPAPHAPATPPRTEPSPSR
ncbi:hypothetical protein B0H13DRAFT_2460570 [Mycena leptocephala]|nr:hypothetical protein B0H13DRAFT_2460570 [Mycena leptocephala]